MRFESLLKKIVRTGIAAAGTGITAVKNAKSAVETAIAEAKAEEERKKAAEAEAARNRAEAAAAGRAREEAAQARREAERKAAAEKKAREEAEALERIRRAGATPYEPEKKGKTYHSSKFNLTTGPAIIRDQILQIVGKEGPVTESLLFERTMEEWWTGDQTDKQCRLVFHAGLCLAVESLGPLTTRLDELVFWPAGVDPAAYDRFRAPTLDPRSRRTFDRIPLEEIAAAIRTERRATTKRIAYKACLPGALERLGLPRDATDEMQPALDAALRLAKGPDKRPAVASLPKEWSEEVEAEKERIRQKEEAERKRREAEEARKRQEAEERRKRREEEAARRRQQEEEERRRREEEEEREREAVSDWAARLAEHPEEAEFFDGWSGFSPEDWIFLLPKQPQFANKCRWGELPEDAADRIVARCPKLRRYKVWDETYEDEEGKKHTYHHDDAAVERGIAALGDPNFWKSFSS